MPCGEFTQSNATMKMQYREP